MTQECIDTQTAVHQEWLRRLERHDSYKLHSIGNLLFNDFHDICLVVGLL